MEALRYELDELKNNDILEALEDEKNKLDETFNSFKEDFERQLKNCEMHDVNFVDITTKDGKKVKFNPKYCAYIEFREVQE